MYKDNNNKAIKGESYVYKKLLENGIKAKWSAFGNRQAGEDFITDNGAKIDVKISYGVKSEKGKKSWFFNVHHHGEKQKNIDFYICIIAPELVFVIPSNLVPGKTIRISEYQLARGRFDYFKENWQLIKDFKKSSKKIDAEEKQRKWNQLKRKTT